MLLLLLLHKPCWEWYFLAYIAAYRMVLIVLFTLSLLVIEILLRSFLWYVFKFHLDLRRIPRVRKFNCSLGRVIRGTRVIVTEIILGLEFLDFVLSFLQVSVQGWCFFEFRLDTFDRSFLPQCLLLFLFLDCTELVLDSFVCSPMPILQFFKTC